MLVVETVLSKIVMSRFASPSLNSFSSFHSMDEKVVLSPERSNGFRDGNIPHYASPKSKQPPSSSSVTSTTSLSTPSISTKSSIAKSTMSNSINSSARRKPNPPKKELNQTQSLSSSTSLSNSLASSLSETINESHLSLLQKQSIRWLNLSTTLWTSIVMDAERIVEKAGLRDFIQVMSWRTHGKITAAEFTALYDEWIGRNIPADVRMLKSRKVYNIGLSGIREILVDANVNENDLDLFVGMLVHETNRHFLNTPINYLTRAYNNRNGSRKDKRKIISTNNLEVCTKKWIDLSEELFFCLDTPGYGELRYDEVFFFASCLTIGLQGWKNESELESDLSLGVLSAITLQLMRDAGATITLSAHRHEVVDISRGGVGENEIKSDIVKSYYKNDLTLNPNQGSEYFNHNLCALSLPMFKLYLMNKGIGDSSLSALVVHIKTCIERMARLTVINAEDMYSSSKPLENQRNIGSPRLWQHSVCIALGYEPSAYERYSMVDSTSSLQQHPTALLVLLSDAERLIPGYLRAVESQLDRRRRPVGRPSCLSPYNELHETAHKLWAYFRTWGQTYKYRGIGNDASASIALYGIDGIADIQLDPVYNLIINALLEYKNLQLRLCAALYDMTVAHYSIGTSSNGYVDPINIVCASLLPDGEAMICALGLDETQPLEDESSHLDSPIKSFYLKVDPSVDRNSHMGNSNHDSNTVKALDTFNPAEIQWTSIFDLKAMTAAAATEATATAAADSAGSNTDDRQSLNARKGTKLPRANTKNSNNSSRSSSSGNNVSVAEKHIIQLMLTTNDPAERDALIEKLRQFSSSNDPVADSTGNRYGRSTQSSRSKSPVRSKISASVSTAGNDNVIDDRTSGNAYNNNVSGSARKPTTPPSISKQNQPTLAAERPTVTAASSSAAAITAAGPKSIADLLAQGQDAGKYAQTLREILRTMTSDDSKVQLKSIEMIIKLGENIVNNEIEKKNASPDRRSVSPTAKQTQQQQQQPQYQRNRSQENSIRGSNILASKTKAVNVPGMTPASALKARKKVLVFGHPI